MLSSCTAWCKHRNPDLSYSWATSQPVALLSARCCLHMIYVPPKGSEVVIPELHGVGAVLLHLLDQPQRPQAVVPEPILGRVRVVELIYRHNLPREGLQLLRRCLKAGEWRLRPGVGASHGEHGWG